MVSAAKPDCEPALLQSRGVCVLMFSGGRDSTLAAVRLAEAGFELILVTITSDHLHGLHLVEQRLRELRGLVPARTRWMHVKQPLDLATDTSFYEQTCLPCHHAYVVVAAAIAINLGAAQLAFGYTHYQSHWPEQTPLAIERLRALVEESGVELLLPVHDLQSRKQASDELEHRGLTSLALEQKCVRQVTNIQLDDERLHAQVALWEEAIRASINKLDSIPMAIISTGEIGKIHA